MIKAFSVGGPDPLTLYRLTRIDTRNIALQRRNPAGSWINVAYCGNNPRSILRTITELAAEHWAPDADQDLVAQVGGLVQAIENLESTIGRIVPPTQMDGTPPVW